MSRCRLSTILARPSLLSSNMRQITVFIPSFLILWDRFAPSAVYFLNKASATLRCLLAKAILPSQRTISAFKAAMRVSSSATERASIFLRVYALWVQMQVPGKDNYAKPVGIRGDAWNAHIIRFNKCAHCTPYSSFPRFVWQMWFRCGSSVVQVWLKSRA